MTSELTAVTFDCHDPRAQAEFWCAVLDHRIFEDREGWVQTCPREPAETAGTPRFLFITVPEGKQAKNRMHVDVSPVDRDPDAEVSRLVALGATRVDLGQSEEDWVVLADPEGNEFCVLRDAPGGGE